MPNRPDLLRELAEDPLSARALGLARWLVAGLVAFAFISDADHSAAPWAAIGLALLLAFLPAVLVRKRPRHTERGREVSHPSWGLEALQQLGRVLRSLLPWVPAYLPLLLLGPSLQGHLLATAAMVFEYARLRRSQFRWALTAALLPVGMGALLLQLQPSLVSLALALGAAALSAATSFLLQRQTAEAKVRREAVGPQPEGEGWRRLQQGLPVALGLGLLSLVFYDIGSRGAAAFDEPSPTNFRGTSRSGRPGPGQDPGAQGGAGSGSKSRQSGMDEFDPSIGFRGGVFAFGAAEVMRLRPENAERVPLGVYLRGVVLDRVQEHGVSPSSTLTPTIYADGEDGSFDGWTQVNSEPPGPGLTFRVDSRRLDLDGGPWAPLFAAEPLAAIELPRVAYDPDQGLFLPDPPEERIRYRFQQAARDWSRRRLKGSQATHPDPATLQLPPAELLPAELEDLLARAIPPSASGLDAVTGLIRLLREEFTYERLDTGFEGLAALGPFLEQRRGFCTHFATLAMVGLRSRDIPARIATGFLAHEWDEDAGEFIVRERNAHAWIEVHFQDIGWVAFDPTPPQEGRPDLAGGLAFDERAEAFSEAFDRWLDGESDRGSLAQVLEAGRRYTVGILGEHLILVINLVLLIVLGRWLLAAAPRWLLGSRLRRRSPAEESEWLANSIASRLEKALARVGLLRRPGQTLMSLAQSAREVGIDQAEPVVQLHYAARWGLSKEALGMIEEALERLERDVEDHADAQP